MDTRTLVLDAVVGAAGLYLLARFFVLPRTSAPLPPGPKSKLLIGNLNDLLPPGEQEWVHWAKHKSLYGPLSSLTVFGQTFMIINDCEVAFEMLEKRSLIYSDRPVSHFAGEMCGWNGALSFLMHSDRFRAYRKNISRVIGSRTAVARFSSLQDVEVRRFLFRVLEEPEKFQKHIRTEAGAIILKIAYGYTIEPHEADPLVNLAEEALEQASGAMVPGRWMVDVLPFLKHIPDWLPGTGFKRVAKHWKRTYEDFAGKPYAFVKKQLAAGVAKTSYTSELLAKGELTEEEEFVVKYSAVSLYAGGADTTVSTIGSFFLVMMLFSEVQRKAQEELDRVVGTDRLPTFEDRASLPYVDACVKELLRWHPVVPMGAPHVVSEDDIYNGMSIPKGTILMPNIWLFLQDEANYKDPYAFKPERFLGKEPEMDPRMLCFGFGRRICPGRDLADASIFLSVAMSLAAFDIRKAIDENGNIIEPAVHFMPGLISQPSEFRCDIRPRSAKAEQLIREVVEEHPWEESDAAALEGVKY